MVVWQFTLIPEVDSDGEQVEMSNKKWFLTADKKFLIGMIIHKTNSF